jgi:hypothetical protein
MKITKETLQTFCSTDEYRSSLQNPFSIGKFTYATNGWVAIRVPRMEDVPENPLAPDIKKAVTFGAPATPLVLRNIAIPELRDCLECNGKGTRYCVCPDCTGTHYCDDCNGLGKHGKCVRVRVGTREFSDSVLRTLATLEGVEIESEGAPDSPAQFTFHGGYGVVMPLAPNFKP